MNKVERMSNGAIHRGEEIFKRGVKIADHLKKDAQNYGKITIKYVKKYPVQSALIAVGIGFLFGKIFK